MESRICEMVRSLAGHDKDEYYLVLGTEGDRLFLINGKNRKIVNPKIKKQKHVQIIRGVNEELLKKLLSNSLTDADVIHALKAGKEN